MIKIKNKKKGNTYTVLGVWILSIIIFVLVCVIVKQNYDYKDAISTKDHFANSLSVCLNSLNQYTHKAKVMIMWECENKAGAGFITDDIPQGWGPKLEYHNCNISKG